MQLLIEDLDFADIGVGVQIEEKSLRRVFWNGCIYMTRWSGWTRRLKLE